MKKRITKIVVLGLLVITTLLVNTNFLLSIPAPPEDPEIKYILRTVWDGCNDEDDCYKRCEPCGVVVTGCDCTTDDQTFCAPCVIVIGG